MQIVTYSFRKLAANGIEFGKCEHSFGETDLGMKFLIPPLGLSVQTKSKTYRKHCISNNFYLFVGRGARTHNL